LKVGCTFVKFVKNPILKRVGEGGERREEEFVVPRPW
jgi:hypothetical protein